jgi:hypothetical protein
LDGDDVCSPVADPAQLDSVGVGDMSDNCTNVANPDQRDNNGDGYGNVCDTDLNNNGTTNFSDLAAMRAAFGKPPGPSAFAP